MATPQPLPRWARWFGAALLVVTVGLITWAAWPRWSTATIHSVTVDGTRLEVVSEACGTDDRVEVDEGDAAVTIAHRVREDRNADCTGSQVTITLDRALGDRLLVDGSDDHPLTCEPAGATVQECVR